MKTEYLAVGSVRLGDAVVPHGHPLDVEPGLGEEMVARGIARKVVPSETVADKGTKEKQQ